MSNHLLPNPNGIDYKIQQLQILLYGKLFNMWGANGMLSSQFEFFGRAYKNYDTDGFEPNVYAGDIKEYREVYYDDKINALAWFGLNDPEPIKDTVHTYNLSLYFFVNLAKIKPNAETPQRVDMEVINEVCNIIDTVFGFQVKSVVHDIDNVLSRYGGSKVKAGFTKFNMHPRLCFRIDMTNMLQNNLNQYDGCLPQSVYPTYYSFMSCTIRAIFKDVPDTSIMQTLCNGQQLQLEYPTGATLTIPYLIGRYVAPRVYLNNNVIQSMPYNPASGEYSFTDDSQFNDGDNMQIEYNVT